jgi:hypothetical protein
MLDFVKADNRQRWNRVSRRTDLLQLLALRYSTRKVGQATVLAKQLSQIRNSCNLDWEVTYRVVGDFKDP